MPFRPFTDFLNQGMRNTNRNAGNANMPSQPNYSNPQAIYGFGSQGGGSQVMGGAQQGGEQYGGGSGGSAGLDTQDEWQYADPGNWVSPGTNLGYPGSWSGGITPDIPDIPSSVEALKLSLIHI